MLGAVLISTRMHDGSQVPPPLAGSVIASSTGETQSERRHYSATPQPCSHSVAGSAPMKRKTYRGVVAPPGESGRYFRIATTAARDRRPDPHAWAGAAQRREHSWWLAWFEWLAAHSSSLAAPPPLGSESAGFAPLDPAPGDYVRG